MSATESTNAIYLVLLIPVAFLALLIVMLVRQRKVDRLFRETMTAMDDEIEHNFAKARTALALIKDPSFVPAGKVTEIGPGYVVTEGPTGRTTTTVGVPPQARMIHSTQELRAWLEADPNDYTTLIGMSCCITRDGAGNITDVKFADTGVVLHTEA